MPSDRPFRRFLVAESPVRLPGERRAKPLPCRIGVLPWVVDRNWLTVIVGATYRFDTAQFNTDQKERRPIPLSPMKPRPFFTGSQGPDEQTRVDDFVPMRLKVDLSLTGHLGDTRLPSGAMLAQGPRRAAIGLGDRRLAFFIHLDKPGKTPLRPPFTATLSGRALDLGPQRCHDGSAHRFHHDERFDLSTYQTSIPEMRYDVDEVTGIYLAGLGLDPEAQWELELPRYTPRALVTYSQARVQKGDVRMFLDGVLVDLDLGTVDLTWRGLVETTAKPHLDVDRILVGWANPDRWTSAPWAAWDDNLRELPRGRFSWAIERDDVIRAEPVPALSEEELLMARYETWGHPNAAEPELPPDEAATIAAELAEQRWPRAEVLARHELDDYAWGIEERAWAQRLASVSEEREGGPSTDYINTFRRVSENLATPGEAEVTASKYVSIEARLQRGNPMEVLQKEGLGLGAFGRIERRFKTKASTDRAFAAELERLRAREAKNAALPSLPRGKDEETKS